MTSEKSKGSIPSRPEIPLGGIMEHVSRGGRRDVWKVQGKDGKWYAVSFHHDALISRSAAEKVRDAYIKCHLALERYFSKMDTDIIVPSWWDIQEGERGHGKIYTIEQIQPFVEGVDLFSPLLDNYMAGMQTSQRQAALSNIRNFLIMLRRMPRDFDQKNIGTTLDITGPGNVFLTGDGSIRIVDATTVNRPQVGDPNPLRILPEEMRLGDIIAADISQTRQRFSQLRTSYKRLRANSSDNS